MRYAQIREIDVSNGVGIGVSLFVQGCKFCCYNCFNQSTWDFNGGKEFTDNARDKFFKLIDNEYVERVSILGGEPLELQNIYDVTNICKQIRERFPNKKIWVYTGYTYEYLLKNKKNEILQYIDVLVDGRYDDDKRDATLSFRGSKNQRLIDVKKSLDKNKIYLLQYK